MYMEKWFCKVLVRKKNWWRQEENKEELEIDPYTVAWMFKRKNELIPDVLGHVSCGISWFIQYFFFHGRKKEATV